MMKRSLILMSVALASAGLAVAGDLPSLPTAAATITANDKEHFMTSLSYNDVKAL